MKHIAKPKERFCREAKICYGKAGRFATVYAFGRSVCRKQQQCNPS
jgi:hypothetical protein